MRSALRLLGSLIGIAGVAFGLTLTSQSMRAVEKIGGSCASGNTPFQPRVQCPNGIAGTFPLGIIGGLVFLAIFAACTTDAGRQLALLAWSALFLLLGWNFLDFGVVHPVNGGGVSAGFLVCAVVFILMGAAPLVWLAPRAFRILRGEPADTDSSGPTLTAAPSPMAWGGAQLATTTPRVPTAVTPFMTTPAPTTTTTSTATTSGVADQLEKLAKLHQRGELTDSEYDAAKRDALKGS